MILKSYESPKKWIFVDKERLQFDMPVKWFVHIGVDRRFQCDTEEEAKTIASQLYALCEEVILKATHNMVIAPQRVVRCAERHT